MGVCGYPMRINGVTYEKLKTPLKVNGNLNHLRLKFQNEMKVPDANWVREIYVWIHTIST